MVMTTFFFCLFLVVHRLAVFLEGQRRKVARERIAADNIQAWFTKHPPVRMVRGHPPRPPRARGRSATRGDYFPFEDEFPSNLPEE